MQTNFFVLRANQMVDDVGTSCVSSTIAEPLLTIRKIASYYTCGIMNTAVSAANKHSKNREKNNNIIKINKK